MWQPCRTRSTFDQHLIRGVRTLYSRLGDGWYTSALEPCACSGFSRRVARRRRANAEWPKRKFRDPLGRVLSDRSSQTHVTRSDSRLMTCANALREHRGREISGLRSSGRLTGKPHLTSIPPSVQTAGEFAEVYLNEAQLLPHFLASIPHVGASDSHYAAL
jgi:hypothetical protein